MTIETARAENDGDECAARADDTDISSRHFASPDETTIASGTRGSHRTSPATVILWERLRGCEGPRGSRNQRDRD
jgi:hypothetical protein